MAEQTPNPPDATNAPQRAEPLEGGSGISAREAEGRPMRVDAASRSLADALQVSFGLLKIVMVLLLLVYLASGVFSVPAGHTAVRLTFGQIAGDGADAEYDTGVYVGLPYPIGEVVLVPTTTQTLTIDDAYWFEVTEQMTGQTRQEMMRAMANRPLNPERDGSLITGDANIVIGQYVVEWKITNPGRFIENIGLTRPEDLGLDLPPKDRPSMAALFARYGLDPEAPLARAELIVRNAVERGVIHATAQVSADDYVGGAPNTSVAVARAQDVLQDMGSGISIVGISVGNSASPPPAVDEAFRAASRAESRKAKLISDAERDAASILSEAAGAAAPALIDLIDRYELAVEVNNDDEAAELRRRIDQVLDERRITQADQQTGETVTLDVGGQVAQRINEARGYANQIAKSIEAEAREYEFLHDRFRQAPQIFVHRMWQDTLEAVLRGDVELIYADTNNLRIDTQTDPRLLRARQQRALDQAREEAAAQQ